MSSLEIAGLVLLEGMKAFQYADDSGGSIGSIVVNALDQIEEIVLDTNDEKIKSRVFEKILLLSQNKVFNDWDDYRISLMRICIHFADDEARRKKLNNQIQTYLDDTADDHYEKYVHEALLKIRLELLERFGTETEVNQFLQKNIAYPSFRERSINQLLKEKKYEQALELTFEGEKKDKRFAGLVNQWLIDIKPIKDLAGIENKWN